MDTEHRDALERSKRRWAYRTVGLIFAGAAVAIVGNTLLLPIKNFTAVVDVLVFLAAFCCVFMMLLRMVQTGFR